MIKSSTVEFFISSCYCKIMKKQRKYAGIDKELKLLGLMRYKDMGPLMFLASEAMAALTVAFLRVPRHIKRTKFMINGYRGEPVRVTFYQPKEIPDNAPCLIYFHGGGFAMREFGLHHKLMFEYAARTPCKVAFVHYRLAHKHPFPCAVEDGYNALVWMRDNAAQLGIDPGKIVVGGDSAGGALAAALSLMARDRKGPKINFQMLLYPVIDNSLSSRSIAELVDCPMCNPLMLKQMWETYLRDGDFGTPQYASPMRAKSLAGLPPAYIETEEFDSLKDEGKAYAERLSEDGVGVKLNEMQGTFHAFDTLYKSKIAKKAIMQRIDALKAANSNLVTVGSEQLKEKK